MNKMFKSGFTLAEVLITLGIIGVVSALTIPSLVHYFKVKELENSFKKTDSLIQQALKMTSNELELDSLDNLFNIKYDGAKDEVQEIAEVFASQFAGATRIDYLKSPLRNNYKSFFHYSINSFTTGKRDRSYWQAISSDFLMLGNGTLLTLLYYQGSTGNASSLMIFVDTNGPGRGPNRWGYDVFYYISNDNYYVNQCRPYVQDTYATMGCYRFAHKNMNPYDNSIPYWKSLYKDKKWWMDIKK